MPVSQRVDVVDALRGYALLGLFLVHCVERFELYWLDPQPDGWFELVFALFAGKAFAVFALLFGFSFATMMENERSRGGDFTLRFAWRLVLLFLIGTVHALVYRGDILQVLAAVGLVMIPFDRLRSPKLLLVCAALLFLQLPLLLRALAALLGADWAAVPPLFWSDSGLAVAATGSVGDVAAVNAGPGMASKWSYYAETGRLVEIAGLFLVGMVLQRQRLLADARERRGLWLSVLLAGAAAWALSVVAAPAFLPPGADAGGAPMVRTSLEAAFDQWRNLAATAFPGRRLRAPLAAARREDTPGIGPGRAGDADALCRAVAGGGAAALWLWPRPVGRSLARRDGAVGPRRLRPADRAGRLVAAPFPLRPARMALARRHADQPRGTAALLTKKGRPCGAAL